MIVIIVPNVLLLFSFKVFTAEPYMILLGKKPVTNR